MARKDGIVGIDVAKKKLDWHAGVERGVVENSVAGCMAFAAEMIARGVGTAVMEASGGYERTVAAALRSAGLAVRIVDPKRVRDFAKAAGRRAKTDPIDAEMLARFGAVFPDVEARVVDPARGRLALLVGERQDFVALRTQLKQRAEHPGSPLGQELQAAALAHLTNGIAKLDGAIAAEIAGAAHMAERADLFISVPGIGKQVAAVLLAWLPELGSISRRKLAALVGVAPFDDQSGNRSGLRHIAGGRKDLRHILYMATVGAATLHNPVLKAFYNRLCAKGKPAKTALIACLRKLLTILDAMVRNNQTWAPATD